MTFIDEIYPHAQRIQKEYGILASLVIAQAIHESNWGKSGLATKGKNLFGIKGSYNGESITMRTWEVVKGEKIWIDAHFRKYPSWYESLQDLANLYKNGVSWDRNKYKAIIGEDDYKQAAKAVQEAGYATDPNYADKIIRIIEGNGLTIYDSKPAPQKQAAPKFERNEDYLHIVKSGDTLSKIAADHHTTVDYLAKLNNISNPNLIYPGQRIKLKGKVPAEPAPKSEFYTVKSGDNMSHIAQKYSTTLSTLKKLNPKIKNYNLIYPGQKIRVK